mgnify:CR=1 FL=1
MSTLYKKILPPLPFILLTGVLWFHLQTMQEPLFFYREQQQIFLFDSTYIFSILKQIGGLATFISQFLIQFFRIPLIGSLVTALWNLRLVILADLTKDTSGIISYALGLSPHPIPISLPNER